MTTSKKIYNNNQIFIPTKIRKELNINSEDIMNWKVTKKNKYC
ncbi:MAG: AbrB/MazE/SpoVT family DNA-binding domain-containing [Methanobrevibacter sp. CfCl-M3]